MMDFHQTELRRNSIDISALEGEGTIKVLGEIIGATNLVAAKRSIQGDNESNSLSEASLHSNNNTFPVTPGIRTFVNSYCIVHWGGDIIHETKVITRNNNPIWSCDTGSLFMFDLPKEEFVLRSKCLRVEVYDKISKKEQESIGEVILEGSHFVDDNWCDEKRRTFQLIKEREPCPDYNEDVKLLRGNVVGRVSSRVSSMFSGVVGSWLDDSWNSQHSIKDEVDDEDSIYGRSVGSIDKAEIDDDFVFGRVGTLAMRFRVASEDDKNFLKAVKIFERGYKYAKRKGNQTLLAGVKNVLDGKILAPLVTETSSSMSNFCTKKEIQNIIDYRLCGKVSEMDDVKRYRVKPYPNPNRNTIETQYLTETELLELAYRPSTNWVEAGSGSLGRIYVEILSCQKLPNKNIGKSLGNKTDPFVCLIYEDCLVETDVIKNCQNPLFMPWTQRAFIFNTMNTLSSLYLGVFDHDFGPFNHKGIGRVTVDLSEFKPQTEYTLKYNLYSSPMTSNRKTKGSITFRIQVTPFCDKQSLLSIFNPPTNHVNVKRRKTLAVARFTCYGKYREDVYSMKILRGFIDEFFEYLEQISTEISYSLDSLLFWRGQVSVFNIELPMYSAAAYSSAIYVIERPRLLPSYFFFCCACILLCILGSRSNYPATLHRSKSFLYHTCKTFLPSKLQKKSIGERISRFEGFDKAEERKKKKLDQLEANKKIRERIAHVRRQMQLFLASLSDLSLDTNEDGVKYNPLSRLLPIQLILKDLMFFIRCAKLVICCEDSAISFILITCCLTISIILFWLPCGTIAHWICRIFVWIVMGPWIRLAEMMKNRKGSERYLQKKMVEMKEREQKRLVEARILKEEAMKLKATRVLRFGRFAIRVPYTNLTRYRDQPLPESYANISEAKIFDPDTSFRSFINVSSYIPGQKHHGVMIPELENRNQVKNARPDLERLRTEYRTQSRNLRKRFLVKLQKRDYINNNPQLLQSYTIEPSKSFCVQARECHDQNEEGFELIPKEYIGLYEKGADLMPNVCNPKATQTQERKAKESIIDERNDIQYANRNEYQIESRCENEDVNNLLAIPSMIKKPQVKFVMWDLTDNWT